MTDEYNTVSVRVPDSTAKIVNAKDLLYNVSREGHDDLDPRVTEALNLLLDVLKPLEMPSFDGIKGAPREELERQLRNMRSAMMLHLSSYAEVVSHRDFLAEALRNALAVWSPHDPGGSGADGETWSLCQNALAGNKRGLMPGAMRREVNVRTIITAIGRLSPEERARVAEACR